MPRWTGEIAGEIADELEDDEVLRRRVLQATGAGASLAVAGCLDGGGGEGTDEPGEGNGEPSGEVRWLMDYNDDEWQDYWAGLVDEYESEYSDVTINMEYVGFQGESGQRLQNLFQSGDPPELFQGTLPEMGLIVGDGRGIPVNDVNDNIREFYDDDIKLIESAKLGGSAEWLVPHGWQTISTFTYRSDIYDQLSLEEPETWDDLLNNAEAIDNDGDIDARGFGLAAQKTGKSSSVFDGFFRSNGGYYYEEVDGEVEVWFPEDKAIETLEFLKQLGQYSPDPASLSWGPTIKFWLSNRIAQTDFVSAWIQDIAFDSDLPDLATSTDLAELPLPSADADPVDRGLVLIDGTPLIQGSNVEAAKHWLTWLYASDVERTAGLNLQNLRLLPSTDAVFESDQYQNSEEMQRGDGYMAEQQDKVRDIAENKSDPSRPRTIATSYVTRFPINEEMMNAVIIGGTSPSDAVAEAKSRYEERLKEGKEKVAELADDYNEYSG